MATKQQGFAHKKGAVAAARKVLGTEAQADKDFEVFEIEGDRFDWKSIDAKTRKSRSVKPASPFATAKVEQGAPLGGNFSNLDHLPAETVTPAQPEELGAPLQDEQPQHTNHAANAFGAMAMQALGNIGATQNNTQRTEKPATERKPKVPAEVCNGVRKPSVGTVCREVWDELEKLTDRDNKVFPDSKQVRELATAKGWNLNNASIEFYQWRKFNGITGRTPKAPAEPKPVKSK